MKKYLDKNVWDATQERLKYIFDNFDNIYVCFSGGKDSGLLLNLCLQEAKLRNRKIGVFHQDFEAQFSYTTQYVERMFKNNMDYIEPYWVCLPMGSRCAISNYQIYWYTWDDEKENSWVRKMPKDDFIINLKNNPFDFYRYKMPQEELFKEFKFWYAKQKPGKTICLVAIRTDESLNRYRAIANPRKNIVDGKFWTTKISDNIAIAHPIYDWSAEDVWIANYKNDFDYNELYDLYYKAGLTIDQMRVSSPFHESAKAGINLYRVIEPEVWGKLLGRVYGVNFAAIYGETKALGYKEVTLPKGHTWKSYTKFLLSTLPEEIRKNYVKKFITSLKFWKKKGGVLSEDIINELKVLGYDIKVDKTTNYRSTKLSVRFDKYPDDIENSKEFMNIPSWKRMAFCIIKNDHLCKYMGFVQSKYESEKQKELLEKYKNL